MSSIQLKQMAEFYKEARSRFLNSNIDLATQRDVVERLHLAGSEPEGVTYAEADASGVPSRRGLLCQAPFCRCRPGTTWR